MPREGEVMRGDMQQLESGEGGSGPIAKISPRGWYRGKRMFGENEPNADDQKRARARNAEIPAGESGTA